MKSLLFIAVILTFSVSSCKKENLEVKKVDHKTMMQNSKGEKLNVVVVNQEDPICGMKTAEYLKDTAVYKGKVIGFCNSMCKEEFKKDPEKYVVN